MDRFNEVWAKIMETFQKVIDSIFAIFGMLGGSDE
ncbi:MAG: iron-containing alcohol dehydrogenase family protein [Ruminococcaceae bacterium]|nr:iron-containing alcohol dehydrogenase family protein [Oscillospiraceae bacterium]